MVVSSYVSGGVRGPYRSERYPVWRIPCAEPGDYHRGLQSVWEDGFTLCVVEHDMEVSDDLIASLLGCPEPFCTWAYALYFPSTSRPEPHYAQRVGLKPPAGGDWVSEGESWCHYTGIGFCKIAPEVRVRPLESCHWSHLDVSVAKACDGRVHIHWPEVEHDHW